MNELYYRSIMIEVTRRCNLKCDHCLRGSAQRKDMNWDILTMLPTGRIGTIQITGGEPSLVKDLWRKLGWYWPYIKANDVWVKTNAKVFHKQWAIDFIEFTKRFIGDAEVTAFSISRDQYHPDSSAVCKYCKLFAKYGAEDIFNVDSKNIDTHQVIKEGRAKDWGCREVKPELAKENDYIDEDIYITVNGDVVIGANNSFKTADKIKIGNILREESLDYLIERHLKLLNRKKKLREVILYGKD